MTDRAMTDPTIPRLRRIAAGRYELACGGEAVRIVAVSTAPRRWVATPVSDRLAARSCPTKQDAIEYAHDWLAEHA